jgi:PAS domain S-box-containing protein
MFWVKDEAGVIIFANRAYAQLLNRTPEDLVGETDETLFPPTMANFFVAMMKESLRPQNRFRINWKSSLDPAEGSSGE